jgi:hypothetical protein
MENRPLKINPDGENFNDMQVYFTVCNHALSDHYSAPMTKEYHYLRFKIKADGYKRFLNKNSRLNKILNDAIGKLTPYD